MAFKLMELQGWPLGKELSPFFFFFFSGEMITSILLIFPLVSVCFNILICPCIFSGNNLITGSRK